MKNIILLMAICQTTLGQITILTEPGQVASNPKYNAVSPRLTQDHTGRPILSWSEEDDSSEVVAFYFSRFNDQKNTFENKKSIRIVKGISPHAEGMPKLAFKKDGAIIAVYETNRPVPDIRFSGDLLYTMSKDDGYTWTTPKYVHADTTPGKSRSFSDLSTLPNGEVGIVWLGEKTGKTGRPIKFTQTKSGSGFGSETILKEGVCECCRTDLFVDNKGDYQVFFRDILTNGARDIGHLVSKNKGLSFGEYQLVYPDKWVINACPHAGPSTAELGNTLYTAWYTGEEKNVGIKLTDNAGKILTHIKSASARHPQLITHQNKLVLVWDQPSENKTGNFSLNIKLQVLDEKGPLKTMVLTTSEEMANYPTVLSNGQNLIIAYEEGRDKKRILYKSFPFTALVKEQH